MKRLNLVQGSPEWVAARRKYNTASEASIVAAMSKNVSRDELLCIKATGSEQEFSEWFEKNILDKGHAVEAAARPFTEKLIAEQFGLDEDDAMLFPVTCVDDSETYLASCDGLTDDGLIGWECKQWNAEKAAVVESGSIPDCDKWQVAQQLMVTGAKHWLYTVSDGTESGSVHVWVTPDMFDFNFLVAIWKQFEDDLKNYQAPEAKHKAVAEEVTALPAVSMVASGAVSVVDNFAVFEKGLTVFLQEKLIREPKTDNDFATLEQQIKAMKKAEEMLKAAGESVLAQVEAVDAAMKKKDSLAALVRENRLMAEKLLKTEKERRRFEIIDAANKELASHLAQMSGIIGFTINPSEVKADFAAAAKGKKTIDSVQSAVNDAMALAKIEVRGLCQLVEDNMQKYGRTVTKATQSLFPDLPQLVFRQADDFILIVKARIAEYEQAQREREEQIRREAEAKAQQEIIAAQRAKEQAEAQARYEAEAARIAVEAARMAEAEPQEEQQALFCEADNAPSIADLPLTTGTVLKAVTQPRTLRNALVHFASQKNLSESDTQELLDIVAHFTQLDASAA